LGVGAVLGLVSGVISIPGLKVGGEPDADALDEIRGQLSDVVNKQSELNRTATEALTLSREAMRALLPDSSQASLARSGSESEEIMTREGESHE
jgi:hypothetical protein